MRGLVAGSGNSQGRLSTASRANQYAFTLIELVSVMMIVGILAVVALPRFADRAGFESAGFGSELTATLKHARKSAVAMRRNVCVVVAANTLTFTRKLAPDAAGSFACDAAVLPLPGKSINVLAAPSGVTVASTLASFAFNALGQPSAAATLTVTGSDGSHSSVVVEAVSGYVH